MRKLQLENTSKSKVHAIVYLSLSEEQKYAEYTAITEVIRGFDNLVCIDRIINVLLSSISESYTLCTDSAFPITSLSKFDGHLPCAINLSYLNLKYHGE